MAPGFHTTSNVLSDGVLTMLSKYCALLDTDDSSHDIWDPASTLDFTLPENYSNQLSGKDKATVIEHLYGNKDLPCYHQKWIKHADIAIQKIVPGSRIPKHTDNCKFSLTVFLNSVTGGEFVWYTDTEEVKVPVETNTGIYAYYDEPKRGFAHEVLTVKDRIRYTLQLFVFDKSNKDGKVSNAAHWSTQ